VTLNATSKLVFCEDDPTIQKLIRVALRATPHELHVASDGISGLALIRRERPDVVFTDITMPGMDGHQLLAAIRADPDLRATPVVFITASAQHAQVEDARRRGATGVLAKPFTMAALRSQVESLTAPH
jgi:CheY-like chemotaxis protein